MPVGLGLSLGDVIAGLTLIKDSIAAVKDSHGASSQYQDLMREVENLRNALIAIEDLDIDAEEHPKQHQAIEDAVSACKNCIDNFVSSVAKYQPHLKAKSRGWNSSVRKIQWAICKKEEVSRLRAQLGNQSSAINMLMLSLQMKERRISANSCSKGLQVATSILSKVSDARITLLNQNDLIERLSREQQDILIGLLQENMRLNEMLKVHLAVAPQVKLQNPVVLVDATGMVAPFHLEFIQSAAALLAVLRIRFQDRGVRRQGLLKLDRSEFDLRDSARNRKIDLRQPWQTVFKPGQHVDMSMVFRRSLPLNTCPSCQTNNSTSEGSVECVNCGLVFQTVTEVEPPLASARRREDPLIFVESPTNSLTEEIEWSSDDDGESEQENDLIHDFRRVRILNSEDSMWLRLKDYYVADMSNFGVRLEVSNAARILDNASDVLLGPKDDATDPSQIS